MAKYRAIIVGMQVALAVGAKYLEVYGDIQYYTHTHTPMGMVLRLS